MILIKNNCSVKNNSKYIVLGCNSLEIIFSWDKCLYYLPGIYKSPSNNTEEYIFPVNLYLLSMGSKSKHIICGGINIDILSK